MNWEKNPNQTATTRTLCPKQCPKLYDNYPCGAKNVCVAKSGSCKKVNCIVNW